MAESIKSRTFTLKNHFVGLPREEDFEVVEKTLPPIADGGQCDHCFPSQISFVLMAEIRHLCKNFQLEKN